MISFENCDVLINGTGIMADNASLSIQSSVSPLYSLGYLHPYGYSPQGQFQSVLQVSYFLESQKEPTFGVAAFLKSFLTGAEQDGSMIISVAGFTGTYYLDTYRIEGKEHSPIKASASFVSFTSLSGAYQVSDGTTVYNTTNSSGLAHFYSAAFSYRRQVPLADYYVNQLYTAENINSFTYNLKASWIAAYGLGSAYPLAVRPNGIEETAEIIHENFNLITLTGSSPESVMSLPDISSVFPNEPSLQFVICLAPYSLVPLNSIEKIQDYPFISISKGVVKTNALSQVAQSVGKITTTILRNY